LRYLAQDQEFESEERRLIPNKLKNQLIANLHFSLPTSVAYQLHHITSHRIKLVPPGVSQDAALDAAASARTRKPAVLTPSVGARRRNHLLLPLPDRPHQLTEYLHSPSSTPVSIRIFIYTQLNTGPRALMLPKNSGMRTYCNYEMPSTSNMNKKNNFIQSQQGQRQNWAS